jgi:hypothetical protein
MAWRLRSQPRETYECSSELHPNERAWRAGSTGRDPLMRPPKSPGFLKCQLSASGSWPQTSGGPWPGTIERPCRAQGPVSHFRFFATSGRNPVTFPARWSLRQCPPGRGSAPGLAPPDSYRISGVLHAENAGGPAPSRPRRAGFSEFPTCFGPATSVGRTAPDSCRNSACLLAQVAGARARLQRSESCSVQSDESVFGRAPGPIALISAQAAPAARPRVVLEPRRAARECGLISPRRPAAPSRPRPSGPAR